MKESTDTVIGMAWLVKFHLKKLKKNSYVLWRKRVRGRIAKHRKKSRKTIDYDEF